MEPSVTQDTRTKLTSLITENKLRSPPELFAIFACSGPEY